MFMFIIYLQKLFLYLYNYKNDLNNKKNMGSLYNFIDVSGDGSIIS